MLKEFFEFIKDLEQKKDDDFVGAMIHLCALISAHEKRKPFKLTSTEDVLMKLSLSSLMGLSLKKEIRKMEILRMIYQKSANCLSMVYQRENEFYEALFGGYRQNFIPIKIQEIVFGEILNSAKETYDEFKKLKAA